MYHLLVLHLLLIHSHNVRHGLHDHHRGHHLNGHRGHHLNGHRGHHLHGRHGHDGGVRHPFVQLPS